MSAWLHDQHVWKKRGPQLYTQFPRKLRARRTAVWIWWKTNHSINMRQRIELCNEDNVDESPTSSEKSDPPDKMQLTYFQGSPSIRKFNLYPSNVSKSLGGAGVRSSFCRVCFPRGANPKMWFKRDFKHKTLQSLKIELHLPPQILILLQIFGHQKMLFNSKLGGGFITFFQFSPLLGDMIQFDSIWLIFFQVETTS